MNFEILEWLECLINGDVQSPSFEQRLLTQFTCYNIAVLMASIRMVLSYY